MKSEKTLLSKSGFNAPIVITPGEPAGIGPDICLLSETKISEGAPRLYITDPALLEQRAAALRLDISVHTMQHVLDYRPEQINVLPIDLGYLCIPGSLDHRSGAFVLACLERGVELCLNGNARALVTGPIQKSVVSQSFPKFTGHTEWLAHRTFSSEPVMMLVDQGLRVALVTTHLPLADVAGAITSDKVASTISQTLHALRTQFGVAQPLISVCGLNPHAGEGGYLGREEIDVIEPVIRAFKDQGEHVQGPIPADTAFTQRSLEGVDAVIAMYHDQGLPVLKHSGFGSAVNVTLGLPIVRTSVDHGTALDLSATGRAEPGSFLVAIELADQLSQPS